MVIRGKRAKRILIKIAAGMAAVLISPPLAALLTTAVKDNTFIIETLWENEVSAYLEREREHLVLSMSAGSATLLYRPPADGGEAIPVPIQIPPVNHEDYKNYENYNKEHDNIFDYNVENIIGDVFQNEAAQVLSQNITDIREELPGFTVVDGRIVKLNYSSNYGFLNLDLAGQVRNETELDNDFVLNESRNLPEIILELNGEPEILIMHTHTTEAFQPRGYDYFESSYYGRSQDSELNIVAVGAEIARSFAEAGITVIHDGTVHDYPVFNGAYVRSAETVRQILSAYPSVKVVLDIHRDAIDAGDGSRVAPVTQVDGRDAAQVMIISAADDGTYDIPYYLQNFHLASLFQQQMEHDYPGITRPVLFQYCQYNQHLTPGSLLIEVGAYGNTLEEAAYAGRLIGRSMAKALLGLKS